LQQQPEHTHRFDDTRSQCAGCRFLIVFRQMRVVRECNVCARVRNVGDWCVGVRRGWTTWIRKPYHAARVPSIVFHSLFVHFLSDMLDWIVVVGEERSSRAATNWYGSRCFVVGRGWGRRKHDLQPAPPSPSRCFSCWNVFPPSSLFPYRNDLPAVV